MRWFFIPVVVMAVGVLDNGARGTPSTTRFPGASAFPVQVLPQPDGLAKLLYNGTKLRGGTSCNSPCNLRTAATKTYKDGSGNMHVVAVFAGEPPEESAGHVDGAIIGMVDLMRGLKGWVIDYSAPMATESGASGRAPEIQIVDAGKWGQGVVLMPSDIHQGVTEGSWELWLPTQGTFRKAAETPILLDSSGACDDESCRSNDFASKVEIFVSKEDDGSLNIVATSDKGEVKNIHVK